MAGDDDGALAAGQSPPKEPLNKSRVAATEAFRDEMREATRRPWQAPRASGATKQIARKAPSLRVSAQWHSSALLRGLRIGTSYSLRRDA